MYQLLHMFLARKRQLLQCVSTPRSRFCHVSSKQAQARRVLGISKGTAWPDLRQAYLKAVLKSHPDCGVTQRFFRRQRESGLMTAFLRQGQVLEFQRVQEAFKELKKVAYSTCPAPSTEISTIVRRPVAGNLSHRGEGHSTGKNNICWPGHVVV